MNQSKHRFLQDAGHGWLEVSRSEVETSGIEVTPYSYYDPQTDMVYLEEDVDMPNFMKASGLATENINYVDYLDGLSGIRNLPRYKEAR